MDSKTLERYQNQLRDLANSARFEEAHALSKRLMRDYPDVFLFAYYEAVYTAEDDTGFTPAEIARRYRSAAGKFRALLRRMNGLDERTRFRTRNEYYWFSRQPLKQYKMGEAELRAGSAGGDYSMGVGAATLAAQYARSSRQALCSRWAKRSEAAWLRYFKHTPNWFNSYFFYAEALGLQGRFNEMDRALARARKIAKQKPGWEAERKMRAEILEAHSFLNPKRKSRR